MESRQSHGQLLKQLLKERNIDIPEFFEILKDEISSLSTVYKLLDSEIISKARLCLICTLFGVSPTYFGKPADYFEPIANPLASQQDKRLVIYNYIKESKGNYNAFVDEYFEAFTKNALQAKENLYILDYLASKYGLKLRDNIAYFHVENKKYFETLQQYIQMQADEDNNIKFDYRRICQLPLHAFSAPGEVSFERKVEFVVESLFEETFEHICWCYMNLGDQFKFYVVQNPIRLYSYYIFDKEAIISEYLRFDMYGAPIPDILFIDRLNEPMRDKTADKLIDNYLEEFDKMQQETVLSKQKFIPKRSFFFCTASRLARIQEKIVDKKQELEKIRVEYNKLTDKFIKNLIMPTSEEKATQKSMQTTRHHLEKEIEELRLIEENLQIKRNIVTKYSGS